MLNSGRKGIDDKVGKTIEMKTFFSDNNESSC
jgi:hypothetical protein